MEAKELYKSKQLLIAAHILNFNEAFTLPNDDGTYSPAIFQDGYLVKSDKEVKAKAADILQIYMTRVFPILTNKKGDRKTFSELGIDKVQYLEENAKKGFAKLPWKLLYEIKQNLPQDKIQSGAKPYGYVVPIKGFGLWDAIYGYLGLASDADTVIGMTWYEQAETPGLGGNISLPKWQEQFDGKVIFQKNADGETNYERAPLGISVVKTSVLDELGDAPAADSAVDGIAGASITVNGVSEAYRSSLMPYRQFLIKAHNRNTP